MLSSVLQLLKASVPQAVALKGISAADPKLKNFLLSAASAGYTADVALDFLRKIAGKSNRDEILNNASFRKAQGIARPDELGAARQSEQKERLKSGAIAATGIAGGLASILSRSGQQQPSLMQRQQQPPSMQRQQRLEGPTQQLLLEGLQQEEPPSARGPQKLPPSPAGLQLLLEGPQQQAQQEPQQQAQQGQQAKPRFFEMAMQGVDFLSLPAKSKGMVGQLMKKLDAMESQGFSWKDRAVQSTVRAIKKIVSKTGTAEQEAQRFEKGYPQEQKESQQQQGQQQLSADEQLAMLIQEYKSQFPDDGSI